MRIERTVQVIDTHTAGEPTRVVLDGLPPIPGDTMVERRAYLDAHGEPWRGFLLREPRGHPDLFGAIVTPPADPRAQVGLLFIDNGGTLGMCGHGTIGAVTALWTLGRLSGEEVVVDTPSGLITCRVAPAARAVTVRNVPAFFLETVAQDGISIHLAYGGNLFALVEAEAVGLAVRRDALPRLIERGMALRRSLNARFAFRHPETGTKLPVELVEFTEEGDPPRNVVVFGRGQVDRSPCGTGTCAKMAFLHAHGRLGENQDYRYRSLLDTEFTGRIVGTTRVGDRVAIIPTVRGSAHVMGFGTLLLTDGDPFPSGFDLATGRAER